MYVSPQAPTALVGSNITLVCTVTQDCLSLPVTILWTTGHHGATSLVNSSQHIITAANISESSLTVIGVDPSVRDYTCTVTTSTGSDNATAMLTVQGIYCCCCSLSLLTLSLSLASPTINSTGGPVQLQEGANKTLECHFDGLPPPSVKWFHDGTLVTSSPRVSLETINATSYRPGIPAYAAGLTITSASYCDRGNYICLANNRVGRTAALQPSFSLSVRSE